MEKMSCHLIIFYFIFYTFVILINLSFYYAITFFVYSFEIYIQTPNGNMILTIRL